MTVFGKNVFDMGNVKIRGRLVEPVEFDGVCPDPCGRCAFKGKKKFLGTLSCSDMHKCMSKDDRKSVYYKDVNV